nr:amidohydrolase [uncultured Sphaerochaeta sp.]
MREELTENLTAFRHDLHRIPECSGQEEETSGKILSFLETCRPDRILTRLGGFGVAAIFESGNPGPAVMLRAETDALPIPETADFPHGSQREGVSHKCGHDGHMAVLAGIAFCQKEKRIQRGRLILLFQPAEETGEGARRVTEDERFREITPDYVFALHNWPGFARGSVVIRDGGMFAASTGLAIALTGKSAHAMAPEEGISPAEALKKIHSRLKDLYNQDKDSDDFSLVTTVGMQLGGEDYGVSPGRGSLYLTVRAYRDDILASLLENVRSRASEVAREESLEIDFRLCDTFPAAVNSAECAELVRLAAGKNHKAVLTPIQGMASSEDVGYLFRASRKGGAVFLIGSGENAPALHSFNYDFDDSLIPCGVDMFLSLLELLSERN